jgi:hypothetical protein
MPASANRDRNLKALRHGSTRKEADKALHAFYSRLSAISVSNSCLRRMDTGRRHHTKGMNFLTRSA